MTVHGITPGLILGFAAIEIPVRSQPRTQNERSGLCATQHRGSARRAITTLGAGAAFCCDTRCVPNPP